MTVSAKNKLVLIVTGGALLISGLLFNRNLHSKGITALGAVAIDAAQATSDTRIGLLDHIVLPITTVTEFADGTREFNYGSGFVAGKRYYTVGHNLTDSVHVARVSKTSFVQGVPVEPSYVDLKDDLAVFELSDELCARHCNDIHIGDIPALESDREVYWLRKFRDEFALKHGRIIRHVAIGGSPVSANSQESFECRDNLVVEIDAPFVPGSSGSPVFDAATDQIVGIIQGSFESEGVKTGYFKPINCVVGMVSQATSHAQPSAVH